MAVLKGVAWADIILCAIARYLPVFLLAVAVGVILGVVIAKCRYRR